MSVPGISASPAIQARLLDLQAIDEELTRIEGHRRRLRSGTDVADAEAARAALRRTVADDRGALEDLSTRTARVQADAHVVEQRLERDRGRLATTSSPKDAHGLEQEIDSLLRRRGALEDDELELMETTEGVEREAAARRAALVEVEVRLADLRTDRDDALSGLHAQREEVRARRDLLVADLPADLVALYDRQRIRYGVGAALLQRGVSQGSNMALTGADLAAVRAAAADAVVLDPESSCILVRTDESGL